jgi:hypothetical protein
MQLRIDASRAARFTLGAGMGLVPVIASRSATLSVAVSAATRRAPPGLHSEIRPLRA